MSRILLLLIFLIWLAWTPGRSETLLVDPATGSTLFLGVFAAMVLLLGLWGRLLAHQVTETNLRRSLKRFNFMMHMARVLVPVWFGFGLFALGWGETVLAALGPLTRWPAELPAVLLGTLPAFAAWMGLWWSQYPADRALREQSILIQLDENLPVHAPPGFWRYFAANLRLQLLFLIVPVLAILLARDLVTLALWPMGITRQDAPWIDAAAMFGAAVTVFIFAPELLRRVLHTRPLPDSPLRKRLEQLCERNGLGYRDILLWQTQNSMGNAAVMGIFPGVRYILLSDLLLETMSDQQIEAVFAHEIGHIMHRHMLWYGVFVLILMLAIAGPGTLLQNWIDPATLPPWVHVELLVTLLGVGAFLLIFGYLSRRFERQADVFAARMMQMRQDASPAVVSAPSPHQASPFALYSLPVPATPADTTPAATVSPHDSYVGEYGARVFASALHRVATINNIPITARSWCHGSIANRMDYVRDLSADPSRTSRFDRFMRRLYLLLLLCLFTFGLWVAIVLMSW